MFKDFLFKLWRTFCSVEQNGYDNFVRVPYEDICVKLFLIWASGTHVKMFLFLAQVAIFIGREEPFQVIFVKGFMRIICVKVFKYRPCVDPKACPYLWC